MKEVKLYDSKSKRLVTLQPKEEGKVNVYFCGPTVYNHAHVGNVRPMIVFDNLRRMLKAIGYDVLFISNYTDVDDKIINAAIKENCSESDITTKYIAAYEALREAIEKYRGTVILVSHEPDFYKGLVTRVINAEEYTLKVL